MKNLAITLSLFVLLFVCVLPGMAQKQRANTKTTPKPATGMPTQPAPTATAPKTDPEQSGTIQGKVIDLGWGDSLTVLDAQGKQHRVRLLGIDAPEKGQNFGPAARQKLSALVFGKTVTVKFQKVDRNGRPLGKVLLGTTDINLEMLKAGLAWYYANDRDLPETDRPLYASAEQEARRAERGLWQDEAATSPWEFRQARRQAAPAEAAPQSEPALTVAETVPEKNNIPDKNNVPDKHSDVVPEKAEAPASSGFPKPPKETITGDISTMTYFKSGCPEGDKIASHNRISFSSIEEAEKAGYKRTPNCP